MILEVRIGCDWPGCFQTTSYQKWNSRCGWREREGNGKVDHLCNEHHYISWECLDRVRSKIIQEINDEIKKTMKGNS
jgi:hypothetical protein